MKKIVLSLAIAFCTAAAFAQTTHPGVEKKQGMKDMRKDIKDVRHDKVVRHHELKNGHVVAAHHTTKDIRADKKDIHHDTKTLKAEGVKHPVRRADRQIHRQHVNKTK
jgi:Ni/Co efflux regulator RcnB